MKQQVVGYTRVSTGLQVEGYGLIVQRKAISDYCKANDLHLVEVFSDDGISGSHDLDTRPGLADLLAAAESPAVTGVVLYRLDRLARDLLLQETMLAKFRAAGATVHSVAEPDIDSDDATRVLIRQVLGAISQFERALIRSRMASGRAAKKALGGYYGGSPPFGMRPEGKELVRDDAESATLARILQLRADGLSLRQIGSQLDTEALKPKAGGVWHPAVLARIIARANG